MLSNDPPKSIRQPRVIILGGAYAGLATALNLLRICDGESLDERKGTGREGGGGLGREGPGRGDLQTIGRGRGNLTPFQLPTPKSMPLVMVLDERDGFFHTVGAPLAHSSRECISKAWRKYSEISELKRDNVSILQGSVVKVDPASRTISYSVSGCENLKTLAYDYLVVATGLRRAWPTVPRANSKEAYSHDAEDHISKLEGSQDVVVIGGELLVLRWQQK